MSLILKDEIEKNIYVKRKRPQKNTWVNRVNLLPR